MQASTVVVPAIEVVDGAPLLSVYVDHADLHDPERGILANRRQAGRAWERRASMSYFDEGQLVFASGVGIRIHGGSDRLRPGKQSFRLYFRRQYGADQFRPGVLFSDTAEPLRHLVLDRDEQFEADGVWHFINPLSLPTLLWGKTFVEDSSGDGNEAFEFSRSLATHQLPYWDLENGHYGFYPQFMLFAYPTQLTFIAIGETEAAQRLPVFFYLLGIYVVLAELARRGRRRLLGTELLLLVGAAVFFLVFHAHHSTYGVTSDLAQPTGVDTFFTFLAASAFYALVARQRAWWAIFALFGSMSLAAGVPFALLFLPGHVVAAWPSLRWTALRTHVLDAVAFLVPWIGYQLFVSIYSRFHPLGVTKWSPRKLLDLRFDFDPTTALVFVATFAIVVAVVPCVSLAFVGRRDRIVRMLGVPVIGYLVVLVVFGRVHPHYLIPLSLFPAAILLRTLAVQNVSPRTRTSGHVAYGVMLLALTIVTLPRDRTPHTTYREFGARTLMLYDAYPAVVSAARRLRFGTSGLYGHLRNGKPVFPRERREIENRLKRRFARDAIVGPYGISHHTWIRYSDRTPVEGRVYDQVLAAAPFAPRRLDGFSRRRLPDGWTLFYHPTRSIFARRAPADQ